jgi:hypothetical protein
VAIVINSFEAVAEAPEQQRQKQDSGEDESNNKSALPEPQDMTLILNILTEQALRSWAH